MVRLPHQREDAADDDAAEDADEDDAQDTDDDDPVTAIFRIIAEYYEDVAKREDEGMGVG